MDSVEHLNEAISTAVDAFRVLPQGHARKNLFLFRLARGLLLRYERSGDLEGLDAVDLMIHEIVTTTPETDPQFPFFLNFLGNFLHVRVEGNGDPSVINELIEVRGKAVQFTQSEHSHSQSTSNLAAAYLCYFHQRALDDLEMAISILQTAVPLSRLTDDSKVICLCQLGRCYEFLYQTTQSRPDLEASIKLYCEAYELMSGYNIHRLKITSSLVKLLFERFEITRVPEDISLAQEVGGLMINFIAETSGDHPLLYQ